MSNSDTALREFAEKWGYTISVNKKGELYNANCKRKLLSDLTALISEHYVDKDIHDRLVDRADELTTELEELKLKYDELLQQMS